MILKRIPQEFTVCKVKDKTGVPFEDEFCFIGKTDEEFSLVCATLSVPEKTIDREDGWLGFRIEGTLDFGLIGIISKISDLLAKNQIGIFAISTYNTDYIFTKKEQFNMAVEVLEMAGYRFE